MASEKLPDFLSPEQREVFERTGRIPEYMINARVKEEKYEPQPDWGENLLFGLNLISNALRFAASSSSQAGKITTRSGGAPVIYEPDQYAQVSDESMKAIHQNRNADYKPSQTSRNALAKLSTHEEKMRRAYAEKAANLDALFDAQARLSGQPTYQEFHAQHGIEYNPVKNDFVSSERYDSGSAPVQQQPPVDPDFGQKPVLNAQQQITQQARYASNLAAKLQGIRWDQRQEAQQSAQAVENPTVNPDSIFFDPSNPKQDILTQAAGGERLPESKLSQVQLNLDIHLAQKKLAPEMYGFYASKAKQAVAQNWLRHDGVQNADETVTYRGVRVDADRAYRLALADATQYFKSETHASRQQLLDALPLTAEEEAASFVKDLIAATMIGSTGALSAASLGYIDLTQDARMAGRMIGASPEVTNNQWLPHIAGFSGMVATTGGLVSRLSAAGITRPLAQSAAAAALYSGAYRREGDLTLENQLQPLSRVIDAALAAGTAVVLSKVSEPLLKYYLQARKKQVSAGLPVEVSEADFNVAIKQIEEEINRVGYNIFKGKSAQELEEMFLNKGFPTSGPDPLGGRGAYINPKTGRSYHIDYGGEYYGVKEEPHIDVNRKYKNPNLKHQTEKDYYKKRKFEI